MAKHKVLIADDHPDLADSLADLLTLYGHEVRCAYNGRHALAVVDEFEPDIVILDINMPLADGYQVARTIRASRAGKQFIIAMTGAGARETSDKAAAAGFNLHLLKPVDLDNLTALLDQFQAPGHPDVMGAVPTDPREGVQG